MSKYGYGVHKEIGFNRGGRLRADLLGVRLNGKVCAVEIKSSVADFNSDLKMHNYLEYVNRLYICTTQETFEKIRDKVHPDIGILVLAESGKSAGFVVTRKQCTEFEIRGKENKTRRHNIRSVICRLAWRGALISKKTTKRRVRRKIPD